MVKARFSYAGDDRVVPFYLQPKLGGNFELRGFNQYRFHDNNAFMAALEHRWYAFSGLEMAAVRGRRQDRPGERKHRPLQIELQRRRRAARPLARRDCAAHGRRKKPRGRTVDLVDQRRLAEGVLMTARPLPGLSRLLAVIALAIGIAPSHAAAQTFYPDDPLLREPTPLPAPDPGRRNLSVLLEAASATFGRPGERHPGKGVIAAQGVNTLGEVLDGAWYVNRHGRTRMSLEELRRGSGDDQPPSMTGPWHVLLLKNDDVRPTIVFRDDNNRVYRLRFDSRGAPELATGAEMISSRFFHALGYHVPETYLAIFDRERLVIETNATEVTSNASVRPLRSEHIDRLLAGVARRDDGRYRAIALKVPTGRCFAGRTISAVRHAQRRPERHRAARAQARFARPSGVRRLAQPHAHGCAPHLRHRGEAGGTASAHPPLPPRLHGHAGQRHQRPEGRVGGARSGLRTEHDAAEHRRPRALHAGLDASELSGSAGGRPFRFGDLRAGQVDAAVRRGAVRQPAAGRHVLGGQASDAHSRTTTSAPSCRWRSIPIQQSTAGSRTA